MGENGEGRGGLYQRRRGGELFHIHLKLHIIYICVREQERMSESKKERKGKRERETGRERKRESKR